MEKAFKHVKYVVTDIFFCMVTGICQRLSNETRDLRRERVHLNYVQSVIFLFCGP